jgi:hypothetical protein
MTQQDSGWQRSPRHWPQVPHSTETEHRLTIVEIEVERVSEEHDDFKESTTSKILWLERGLQALAYCLLTLAFWLAPGKASSVAEAILGIVKR